MPPRTPRASREVAGLIDLMAALRDPVTGCPWDIEQSFASIAPYTIEEAYEVADAIARGDLEDVRDELGDLLLQVVFHARMAEEQGAFDFGGVVEAITAKLIRRHPHVFGNARDLSSEAVKELWDEIKRQEKAERAERRGQPPSPDGVLDGIPSGLPALVRADAIARNVAAVGFAWPDADAVLDKVGEELGELREAVTDGDPRDIEDEFGDLLFTVANLGRFLGIQPETALAAANRKFERRFRGVEAALAKAGRTPAESDLPEMDRLWTAVKKTESVRPAAPPPESD